MSRIPQTLSKENKPGLLNRRPLGKNLTKVLSDAEKTELLANHTKPMKSIAASSVCSTRTQFKRSVTLPAPGSRITKPGVIKPEVKTISTIQRSGPNRDFMFYKTHYNELLEKHRAIKSEFTDLKDKHEEFSDEYEKIKETALNTANERDALKEKLLKSLNELKERSVEYEKLRIDCELQKHENEELIRKMKVLEDIADSFKVKSAEFDRLKAEFEILNRRHMALKEETEALRTLNDHLKKISVEHDQLQIEHKQAQEIITGNKVELEDLQSMLAAMYKEQRDLRNTVQDLKGNIRVYCRIRPPLESESNKPLFSLNVLDACSIEVEKVELNSISLSSRKGRQQQSFTFDGIFTPHASQEDVFIEVSSMIQSALDGYNVCIFAYGQTGSGKTYTMEGGCGAEQYGIIPRAFTMIFTCMNDLKKVGWELSVKASFLEIYNEVIYDLLEPSKDQENHDIKMVNSKGIDVYVSNLKEEEVKSSYDFTRLMISAQRNRQTAATLNNERSSRSHAVTQIKISAINEKRKEKFTSNLNLVDLAGSESGKFSQRMDETKHINRSLSELSKVILSLQTNQAHIPYRNSKLTHLLMPSLGGNSKTLMLVNVNQFDECFSETLNSLRFATKVNSCRTVKAKKNITMVDS